jgi:hypothetical protein
MYELFLQNKKKKKKKKKKRKEEEKKKKKVKQEGEFESWKHSQRFSFNFF